MIFSLYVLFKRLKVDCCILHTCAMVDAFATWFRKFIKIIKGEFIMKKRFLLPFLLMLLFSCSTVYATNITENEQIEEVNLTDENRYDSIYYQEPKVRFPVENIELERSARANITLEEHVVNALQQLETSIDVSAYQISVSEAGDTFFQILNQHPELFYVSGSVRYSYNPTTNMITSYTVSYLGTEEEIRQQQETFEQSVDAALEQVETSMSNVEKALVVHDYLVLNCEYDKENLDNNTVPDVSHSAYGAMVNQVAVCDGYSKAYAYIMEGKLGISCDIVSSDSMNHAWNMISIDGNWYHVDATWDDPTWDSIGRAVHSYFLLSDTVISDSEHRHTGWSTTNEAESNIYDTAFWSNVNSAICYQRGNWYYTKCNEASRTVTLVKKGELLGTEEVAVYTENGLWNNYLSSYMYLSPVNDKIYFNTKTSIVRMNADGTTTVVYEPALSGKQLIFGFKIKGEELYYALQETPNLTSKQTIYIYNLPELKESEIEGIHTADVNETYNGSAKTITVNGTQAGDIISYALKGETYTTEQPEMINAGTYQVLYKVERSGYKTFYGTATVIIEKATPTYTIPKLKGISGKQLKDVKLPKGFTWQTTTSITFVKEGTYSYFATYTPQDTKNYKKISNIKVQVTVTCPGHQYTSKVTKEPTETKKGQRTYTCKICKNTYTKEIAMLSPRKPAKVSGLKLSKATTNSLKFSWKKVKNVKYRIIFYKGKQKVSTKYTSSNSCTYSKLKIATEYTLKITPYREVNKKKVYASSTGTIKTATKPAKATLSSVKKSGNGKIKITWKKVTGASGYEIRMKTGNGKYKIIKTISKGKTVTFTKTGLKKGKTYSFQVRAYKSVGKQKVYGDYSNKKDLKLK